MKRFAATAAAALAAFTIATPAQAKTHPVEVLLNLIADTGTTVVVDDARICKNKTTFGMYEFEKDVIDQLTICAANHKGDEAELFDTVLHESVHVVQACKGDTIFGHASIMAEANPKEATLVAAEYPRDQFVSEMEARVIASQMDIRLVINLVEKFCFE
jgi:hypothetical protein